MGFKGDFAVKKKEVILRSAKPVLSVLQITHITNNLDNDNNNDNYN